MENEEESLSRNKMRSFEIMHEQWMTSEYTIRYPNINKVLTLAALIPPSTAEVERTFSLMKRVCTRTIKRFNHENLGACMYICKYKELSECEFQKMRDNE